MNDHIVFNFFHTFSSICVSENMILKLNYAYIVKYSKTNSYNILLD